LLFISFSTNGAFPMKIDNIKQYINLRDSLVQEKAQLEERLQQINRALGAESAASAPSGPAPAAASPSASARPAGKSKRGRPTPGGMSLRDAVLTATAGGPLNKQEILDAIHKLGYRFTTKNPMNSLGVILYGKNPKFHNENGRFSPAGGAPAPRPAAPANGSAGAFSRSKRTLSPEARERIAAAQRARWAKAKGGA
jgi:hypothetical protein